MTARWCVPCLFQDGNNEILWEFINVSEVKIGTRNSKFIVSCVKTKLLCMVVW